MAISNSPRPSWRQTVVAAATRQATAEARHAWRVRPGVAPPFNYRLEHIRAVVAIVGDLAAKLAADDEVVTAAAWLHDVSKGFAEEPGDGHGLRGAERARAILRRTDFPRGKIEAVAGAISAHVGLFRDGPIEPIEAAILFDADKLSKLGAASLIHFLCSFPASASRAGSPPDTASAATELKRWSELAPRIVESLTTEPGRAMGRERLALLQQLVAQLEREGAM
ncbi:MAG TPA: HD domain-containing protein [Chloroflexota bacterium]|nr:HD domain-containing protein [Chloroflexota bacterium]